MVSGQIGKDIKAEADEARRSVPSHFHAAPKNLLTDTFETKVAALSDDVTRRNDALRRDYDEDHDERQAARAGVLDGRIRDDMFGDRERRFQRQAEEKRKDRARTSLYLAMLDAQINELDRQIAANNRKIADIEDRIFTAAEREMLSNYRGEERRRKADELATEKVARGAISQADRDEWNSLQRKTDELQSVRDRKAAERAVLLDNPDAKLAVTEDGQAFTDGSMEEMAKQVDNVRAKHGLPPIDRTAASHDDLQDMSVKVMRESVAAYVEQIRVAERQQEISGTTSANTASALHALAKPEAIEAVASVDETVERFMKRYAEIEAIDDPRARLEAEQEFVRQVRSLPEDLTDAAMEIEFAQNTSKVFEEGYFDKASTDKPEQRASLNNTPDNQVSREEVRPSSPLS